MKRQIFWEIVEEVAGPEISTLPITNYRSQEFTMNTQRGELYREVKTNRRGRMELQLRELGNEEEFFEEQLSQYILRHTIQ